MTAAARWQAVERKVCLAGNGHRPCPEAQHRGLPLSGSFQGACRQGQPPAPQAVSTHRMFGPDFAQRERTRGSNPASQSLKQATAIPCGLRLVLNPLGRSASMIIT